MNENQRTAIQKLSLRLIDELNVDPVILELQTQQILTINDIDVLKSITTTGERRQKLLDMIINKDNSWDPFLNALDNANQHCLRTELDSEAHAVPTDQFNADLIPKLERCIRNKVEHIRRFR